MQLRLLTSVNKLRQSYAIAFHSTFPVVFQLIVSDVPMNARI